MILHYELKMNATARYVLCLLTTLAAIIAETAANAQDTNAQVITNSIGMKLTLIPAGTFLMGSPAGEAEREAQETQHEVEITRPFYMGVYEVTQREFHAVLEDSRNQRAFFDASRGGGPDHPIENVEWQVVLDYCQQLSDLPEERRAGRTYRLPTEAEWEYACRAGTSTPFHFGESLASSQANFNGNYPYGDAAKGPYLRRTTKVGSFKPNAFGLYDMHGNVAEICADWYNVDYYRDSPRKDPTGPPEGAAYDDFGNSYFTARGGCWLDDGRACRSARRYRAMLKNRYQWYGFRVVIQPDEAATK